MPKTLDTAKSVLPDLSVVIVNWNTEALLRQCLGSVYTVSGKLQLEVYVVDNGSTDGSIAMIESEFRKVRLLINTTNDGFAKANNRALTLVRGRYVLLLNSDTIIRNYALDQMIAFLDSRRDVAAVGCRLLDTRGELQVSAGWFPSIFTPLLGGIVLPRLFDRAFGLKRFPGQIYLLPESHERTQEVDWICGACLMVRQGIIEDVGPLDENFFMYGEEIDWCLRIKKRGWKVFYLSEPEVTHLHGGSAARASAKTMAIERRVVAERRIIRKHYGRYAAMLYELFMFATAFFKFPAWWCLKVLKPSSDLASNRFAMHRAIILSILRNNWTRS
jgi:GT2 family glycosyltransferase